MGKTNTALAATAGCIMQSKVETSEGCFIQAFRDEESRLLETRAVVFSEIRVAGYRKTLGL